MIRVAICQFGEETNTFVDGVLELTDLCPTGWVSAENVVSRFSHTKTYICGALDAIRDYGAVAVPMDIPAANGCNFIAGAVLSDTCIKDATERICNELTRRRSEYDCIFFAMHGAAVAISEEDVESFVLRALRKALGDVLIMGSLDLHGNITEEMVLLSDGFIGLKTVPHIDCYDAGYCAAQLLCRSFEGKIHPKMALCRIPLLISSAAGCTMHGTGKQIKEYLEAYAEKKKLLDVSFFHGFSSADRPCSSASILVTADGYIPTEEAKELARYVWKNRYGFIPESLSAKEAVDKALTLVKNKYAVINEASDNPGSGCPGDSTHLLREFLARDLPRSIMGPLYDPAAAEFCHRHKIGERFSLEIGGHTLSTDAPLSLEVELMGLSDGTYVSASPVNFGVTMHFGKTARVRKGKVEVILVSERFQTFDDRPFLITGCDMANYSIVGLKSMNHFRAYFSNTADGIVAADTPGLRPALLKRAPYQNVCRPIFPLDEDMDFAVE